MTMARDNTLAAAGMPLGDRRDETALFQRIKVLEEEVAALQRRVRELEAGKGM